MTTSPPGVRIGSQAPRVRNAPIWEKTKGDEVVDFMAEIGRPLDPWQAAITLDAFGVRLDGLWSAFELLLLLSRQNGKGGVTEAIELGGLFLFHEPLILHSAHQFKTSTAAFRRLQDIIDGSDWLTRRVKMISRSKGDESIELTRAASGPNATTNCRLQFVARTLGSARGLTGSTTVFDEAWALTIGQYAAQTPTLATIPNPRIVYTTTPPDDDIGPVPEDAMLPSVRLRAHEGDDRVAVYEWSPPDGFDRTDPDVWYDCNPALGIRISEWFLAKQLTNFTAAGKPEKFDTEHLGHWPLAGADQWRVIAEAEWTAARSDPEHRPQPPVAFALETALDRSWSSIGVAGRRADGRRQVEVVDRRSGTGWVVARAKELTEAWRHCAFVVDPAGGAASLIPALEEAGIEVYKIGTREVAAAAGMLFDGIAGEDEAARDVRYVDHPALTAAVEAAAQRPLEKAWTWSRRGPVDTSPLVAVSNALFGHALKAPSALGDPSAYWL